MKTFLFTEKKNNNLKTHAYYVRKSHDIYLV